MSQDAEVDLDWNLSDSRLRQDVGWPKEETLDFYDISKPKRIRIRLPADRMLVASAVHILCDSYGDKISEISIDLGVEKLDNAVNHLEQLCEQWQLKHVGLNDWSKHAKAGDLSTFDAPGSNSVTPSISASISPAIQSNATNWHIVIVLFWDTK